MLTEQQKRAAQAIVNIFETGTAAGNYGDVTLIEGDPGHLTYGRSQTTLGSGNLYLLLRDYCAAPGAPYAAALTPYLPRIRAKDLSLDNDGNLKSLLRQAGDDPVMQTTQDVFFDKVYWNPALASAQRIGCTLPLSVAVVYDSHIHGSWPLVRDKTHGSIGTLTAVGEKAWIEGYVKTRLDWLANHSIQILHQTVYRMKEFDGLIQAGNWTLDPPMLVRGVPITTAHVTVTPNLKVVRLADNSVIECHPGLEGNKTRVDMRAVCDAIQIVLPTGEGLAVLNPEVVPPGVTRVDLRPLVENAGWEILTHKMAEDGKIYLRKKA